ncbi:MAG: outer membrane protein assembly factor BamA [Candidatus Hydrogenedentota bacterium]|nr:MAG: outer membrane protein assembly factor BamA [Candidatus Hydrogenedentota bacterium]
MRTFLIDFVGRCDRGAGWGGGMLGNKERRDGDEMKSASGENGRSPRGRAWRRNWFFAALMVSIFSVHCFAVEDPAKSAALFEEAAVAREEAAAIWENLGEGIKAAKAWAEAAAAWEKAGRMWEEAGNQDRAAKAWERFHAAIVKRDRTSVKLEMLSGNHQKVSVGALSDPLQVRVVDGAGNPVSGVEVRFEVAAGPEGTGEGKVIPASTKTDHRGRAECRVRAGRTPGKTVVSAVVPDLAREGVTFTLDVQTGEPARLEVVSGNNQVVKVNERALAPLVVRVTDRFGNPVANVPVTFRLVSIPEGAVGAGLSRNDVVTDASGLCGVRFRAGHLGGSYLVLAESGDLEGSPSRFEIIARQTIPTFRVTGIRVEGTTDTRSILVGGRLKVNETYLLSDLNRIFREELKRVYATGRFDDVAIYVDEDQQTTGEGEVIFRVKERPTILSVKIVGAKKVKEADLVGGIGLSPGSPYSQPAVEEARQTLLSALEEKGFLRATVGVETAWIESGDKEKPGGVDVTFRISEGSKVKIARMNFIGNKAFSDWILNWHMKTGKGKVYKEAVFEEDREKILQRYVDRGYLSAVMEDPVISYDKKGRMVLDIVINEGPRYRMGEVTFSGNQALDDSELAPYFAGFKGKFFRGKKFFRAVDKVRSAFARLGYAEVRVVPQEKLDPENGIVDFVIRIKEGKILYLEEIVLEGNFKTKDRIILREIHMSPGDILNGEEIAAARTRLEKTGYFEPGSVRLTLQEGSSPEKRRLIVQVAEGKTGQFQFGAGYSSADGLVGFASLSKKNFDPFDWPSFTGAGQNLTFSAEFGGEKNSYSLSWTEPYWRGKPISLGFDFFNVWQEREGFDWRRDGFALRLSHKYGANGRLSYKFEREKVAITNVTSAAPTDIQIEAGFPQSVRSVRTTTALTTGFVHDTRDDVRFPTEGHWLELSNELAGTFFGGNVSFTRPNFTFKHFIPIGSKHVFAYRFQYSTVSNFFDRSNPIPSVEKYVIGGATTIRGYRERTIQVFSPDRKTVIGPGKTFTLANFEYRVPFSEDKSISAALFADVGGVFAGEFEFDASQLVAGVGGGVRLTTPLGPIRLDYGFGLNFPNKGQGVLHFSMGQMF